MPTETIRKYPQMIDKIAELRVSEPELTRKQIADRLETSEAAIREHSNFLNRANGDADLAIAIRNDESNKAHIRRRAEAREWRTQLAREWQASGINDTTAKVTKHGKIGERIARLDRNEPGLSCAEAARRVGSTADSVRGFRYRRRQAAKAEAEWQASGIDNYGQDP